MTTTPPPPSDAPPAQASAPSAQSSSLVYNDLAGIKPPTFSWEDEDLGNSFKKFRRYCDLMLSTPTYANRSNAEKVNYILLWLGPQGVEIYDSWTHLSSQQLQDPTHLWQAFQDYFEPKTNFRLARYQLRDIRQKSGEPIDSFVTRLKTHSKKCRYPESVKDDMIIEQVIVGVAHSQVRKQILDHDPDKLTLDKCLDFARTFESTSSQLQHLQPQSKVVNVVNRRHTPRKTARPQPKPRHEQPQSRNSRCMFCGGDRHNRAKCPARNSDCKKCHKTGHWAVVCLSKKSEPHKQSTHVIQEQHPVDASPKSYDLSDNFQNLTFDSIEMPDGTQAYATLKIEPYPGISTNLKGKIDTGSQGNILPLRTFAKLFPKRLNKAKEPTNITPCDTLLTAYNGTLIKQYGYITMPCTYKNQQASFRFYIADTTSAVIFGFDMCLQLGLLNLNYNIKQNNAPITNMKQVQAEFPDRFTGIGKLPGEYQIQLKESVKPVRHAPRSAPIQLRDKIQQELERMEKFDIIKRVREPTDWVSSITYVTKADGSLRICLDPSDLNKALKRGQHHIPTMEELSHKFSGAKYFSKLDARSGYWAVRLAETSQLLTTFNTPFGRYCFKRLPFGLSVSQDVFQAAMDDGLRDLPGIVSIADDIAVYGKTEKEHDNNLRALMKRAQEINMIFNASKCQIKCDEIPSFGNIYSSTGVKPDPKKVQAVIDLKAPTNKSELQSFLGFITYLAPFIPNLSEHTSPLRKLLHADIDYQWQPEQQSAFETLKRLICEANTLAYFDKTKPVTLQVDASQEALGAALTQEGNIIAFASKSLSDTEKRYPNIDREMLACVFGAERFHTYVFGKHFNIESDHQPLEIISKKPITAASARLQRMLLRLQRYDYTITYRPGKEMILPDSLSRMISNADNKEIDLDFQICHIQFSTPRLRELISATREDPILSQLLKYVLNGFPDSRRDMHSETRNYWSFRDELSIEDGILLKGTRIIIPSSLTSKFMQDLHMGHLGVTKCQQRAKSTVYWPNIDRDIEEYIRSCETCQRNQSSQPPEKLIPITSDLPNIPWYTLGTDLFTHENDNYLIISDYMSKYPIIERLGNDSTSNKIANLTSKYISMFGIPHQIISDNGPQFTGKPYQKLMQKLGITHTTSSPHHPRSHGFIERAIRTVKATMRKEPQENDMAILAMRTTPIGPQLPTPAELIFGRKIGSNLPITTSGPSNDNLRAHREKCHDEMTQKTQREYPELHLDQNIYFQDVAKKTWSPGTVIGIGPEPRSYTIEDEQTGRSLRRNRELIRKREVIPPTEPEFQQPTILTDDDPEPKQIRQPVPQPRVNVQPKPIPAPRSPYATRSRSGHSVKRPNRLIESDDV